MHFRKFENSTLQLTWSGLKNNETYTANLSLTSDLSPKEPFQNSQWDKTSLSNEKSLSPSRKNTAAESRLLALGDLLFRLSLN